jgi:hypothetical protein
MLENSDPAKSSLLFTRALNLTFFASCGPATGVPRGSAAGIPRGSAARIPRPCECWFLGVAYCVAGLDGGVFAQSGTMSPSLLLPEQLASSAFKTGIIRIRITRTDRTTKPSISAAGIRLTAPARSGWPFDVYGALRCHRCAIALGVRYASQQVSRKGRKLQSQRLRRFLGEYQHLAR